MRFTYSIVEYKKQLEAYNELESLCFSPTDSKEHILTKLEERSAKKRVLSDVANTIIREYVETFECQPDLLTPELAKTLDEFEDLLFPDGKRVVEVGATDYGIYYRVSKILAAYYKKHGDIGQYVTALNRCSLGHIMLINAHSYHWQPSPYYEEVLALARKLNQEAFDEDAKRKILVNLVRSSFAIEKRFNADELITVYEILKENFIQPYSPYELRVFETFFDSVLQMFREFCFYAKIHGLPVDKEKARPLLQKAREFLLNLPDSASHSGDIANVFITDYFLGDRSLEEVLDRFEKLQVEAEKAEDSFLQIKGLSTFSYYYLKLLRYFSDLPKEEVARLSQRKIHDVLPKLLSVSHISNNVQFNRYIVQFLDAASLTGSFDEFAPIILESTVYADKPLYIHTVMVREMSKILFDYMVEKTPEVFDGVAGKNIAYIKEHKEEMKRLLSDCCMYHDIGKFFMLDVVENSLRRLTPDEYALIQEHPENFNNIIERSDDESERVRCIRDCALGHHRWHDGTHGYPDVPQTKNRPFVDVVALADSIDAATDYLGRPYYDGKRIEDLFAEIKLKAGTQYGPEAVAALSDPEVCDQLRFWISKGRKEIYYQIYAFNEVRSLDD